MRFNHRLRAALFGCLATLSLSSHALAACGPDKIGTSRTITLDPAQHSSFVGHEKSLGLRNKEIILTFDDGPLGGKTTSILKTLSKNCVKATFFYVGKMASTQGALVRRVVREGHTLAHHTHNHSRLTSFSTRRAGDAIDRGISTLDKIAYGETSMPPKVPFFRYPYLARNKATDALLKQRGLIAFDANIDSLDWKLKSSSAIHDRIMRLVRKKGRGIVLMHDIHSRTAKMLPRLLRSLNSEGYKIVHIVPKGGAAPKIDPVVVASVEPSTPNAVKPVAARNKPVLESKVALLLNAPPPTKSRVASKPAKSPTGKNRSGVVVLERPNAVAKANVTQLKDRTRKRLKRRETVRKKTKPRRTKRIASLQKSKRAPRRVGKGKWKLRRSHWIIN